MRVAADAVQLALPDIAIDSAQRWSELPEATRVQVLSLLSALIARGVLLEEPDEAGMEVGDE